MTQEVKTPHHVFGLAFTSPTAVVPAIDKTKFKTCLFDGAMTSLQELITPGEDEPARKRIVLVRSMHDFQQVQEVEGVHAFLIFDDPATLNKVDGLHLFDCTRNSVHIGWRKIRFKPAALNAALEETPTTSKPILFSGEPLEKKLKKSASFQDLLSRAMTPLTEGRDTVECSACQYATGQVAKRSWTSKVVKPIRALAQTMESLIELERYVENSKECDALWRAFYDHAEQGVPLEEAAKKYKRCDLSDLKYVCSVVTPKKGLKFVLNPADEPYAS